MFILKILVKSDVLNNDIFACIGRSLSIEARAKIFKHTAIDNARKSKTLAHLKYDVLQTDMRAQKRKIHCCCRTNYF